MGVSWWWGKLAQRDQELTKNAKEQLVRANARLLGVVLNKVKVQSQDYYYYYYYHRKNRPQPDKYIVNRPTIPH